MNKVLLIRFSSIGDIVLTSPVIRALKKQTSCELHVLTKAQYGGIYESNPYVDKVHSFRDNVSEVVENLKSEKFDFVVDLQKNLRSRKLRRLLKLPSSTFPKYNTLKWILVNFKVNQIPDEHVVERYFESVIELNVVNDQRGLDYFIPPGEEVEPGLIDPALKSGYIGFVIGGRHNTKIFPAEKVISVIGGLQLPVVLLGGPADKERGEQIVQATSSNYVYNGCGQFTLNQSASLVKQASLIITNDTGLMHIAAAFQKPIISIWGNTVPAFGMYPYVPGNERLSFISGVEGLRCRPCSKLGFKKCPKKHFKCMLNQDEARILEKAKALIEK